MTRRLAIFAPLALFCMLIVGGGSASASVPAQLISPASSSVQAGGNVHVSYTLPTVPDLGSVHITFTTPGNWNYQYGLSSTATSNDFTFPVASPSLSSEIYSGSDAIPDGLYTVTLSYTSGGPEQFATSTSVRVKTVTSPPNLISPVSDSKVNALSISYSLPDAPLANSTALKIYEFDGPLKCTLNLTDVAAASVRTFTLNPASLLSPSEVFSHSGPCAALPDGDYEFQLSYMDAAGDTPAATWASPVSLDTLTQAPTLVSPATGADKRGNLAIEYTLPEAALASSVELHFAGPSNSVVHLTKASAGTESFTLDPNTLADPTKIASVSGDASLASGLYSVDVSYMDALGNPRATSALATNVQVGPAPVAPPASGGGGGGEQGIQPETRRCVTSTSKAVTVSGKLKDERFKLTIRFMPSSGTNGVEIDRLSNEPKVKTTFTLNGKKFKLTKKGPASKGETHAFVQPSKDVDLVVAKTKFGGKTDTKKLKIYSHDCSK